MAEKIVKSPSPHPLIVGIGASAGGLEPLERFLRSLPKKFGFALVFIQHLSTKHKNLLPELIRSRMPDLEIVEIAGGRKILPGRLYLAPPGMEVRLRKGVFHVDPPEKAGHVHFPIDEFFISLAAEARERAIAVILSGAGTDGVRGLQAVRSAGGAVFVQDPETAEFTGMPFAAINTGQADAVLPPADMVGEIVKIGGDGAAAENLITPGEFETFFNLLHEKTGSLFHQYKKSVVSRRIRRRMYLHGVSSIRNYLEMVKGKDAEAALLAQDLMIGVTSFFRDRVAWRALRIEVVTKLAAENTSSPVRVWTPACATGEEAYSIAMMLHHELALARRKREIQIFATDVNDRALEKAREGKYPGAIVADVPPDFMRRYFTCSEDGLSVIIDKEIREQVVFAKQDILNDPPFSRLDAVICRNFLIYLEPDAQNKCIALFHYALKDGGYLFLGNAESVGGRNTLFKTIGHKKCRIYRKIETRPAARLPLAAPYAAAEPAPSLPARQGAAAAHHPPVHEIVQETLLEEYAPAAVAIDQTYGIVYHNGPTNRYLRQPRGTPTQNLLDLLPENLHNRIRGALYRVIHEGKAVSIRTSIAGGGERKKQFTLHISKLRENLFLITFREKGGLPEQAGTVPLEDAAIEETAVRQLESELSQTRQELRSHIEQLRTLNEELQSSNEELQAANEELETSREELQSLNEELTTVNTQLQDKIDEQDETNNDLNNFLESTSIPTVFLDDQFRMKRFTPAMLRLIKLIPADTGRPIIDMSQEHLGPELIADAQAVLDRLMPVKREINVDGAWYVRTALPYRTSDNRIEGVVVTYTDVSEQKHIEEELRREADLINLAYDSIFVLDMKERILFWNRGAEEMYGWTKEEAIGKSPHDLLRTRFPKPLEEIKEELLQNGRWEGEIEHIRRDGTYIAVASRWALRRDASGNPLEILETNDDISDWKSAEERARHLGSFPQLNPNPVLEVSSSGQVTFFNPATQRILEDLGMDKDNVAAFLPPDMAALLRDWDRKSESTLYREVTIKDRVYNATVHLAPQFTAARIYASEITARKQAEEVLKESEERLRLALDIGAIGTFDYDVTAGTVDWDARCRAIMGLPEGTKYPNAGWSMVHPEDLPALEETMIQMLDPAMRDSYASEYRILRPDGEVRWVAVQQRAIFDESANPAQAVQLRGVVRDITERKQADEEREIASGFLHLVNESRNKKELSRMATTFFQEHSRCEAVGIRLKEGDDYPYYETRGFPPEFVLGENFLCARDNTGRPHRNSAGHPIMECMCGNVIQGRFDPTKPFFTSHGSFWTNCTTEHRATTREEDRQARTRNRCNEEGYESVALLAIRAGDKPIGLLQLNDRRKGRFTPARIALWERLSGYLGVALEKLQAEEALKERTAELESANRELESFIYSVSHDLHAPLRTVGSFTKLIAKDYADRLDTRGKDYFRRIMDASGRMDRIIDDLLHLSRVSRYELVRTEVDLSAMASTVITELRESSPGRSVEVSIQEGLTALADTRLIQLVLSNLLGNAWKFTAKKKNASIAFGSGEREGVQVYYVRDNGAGFDAAYAEKIFQPFQRLHSTDEFEGTGIGLAIVDLAIRRHGGKVWAQGECGKGAAVFFTLAGKV